MTGIRTLDDIKDRCRIEDECWIWKGATIAGRIPTLWSPELQRTMSGGRGLFVAQYGVEPDKKLVYYNTCGNVMCMNPAHRKLGTRKQMAKLHTKKAAAVTVVKQTLKRRARSSMTWERVEAIRAEKTTQEAALKHGVTAQHASKIRRYHIWRPAWLDQIAA